MYAMIGREAMTKDDNLLVLRTWLDRVSLMHYDGEDWYAIQQEISRQQAIDLGCDRSDVDWTFEGIA